MPLNPQVAALQEALRGAQGTAEFAVVVVTDIRGFSKFSRSHESPETAVYIKRIYLQLIEKYFGNAKFIKPTGDGLLLIFPFTETNLAEIAHGVVNSCSTCLSEFATICDGDPMINFPTPSGIGFGISRGPVCCLHSGDTIIDYSGHLLNLAARLMDLARPSGIVIDGNFSLEMIPSEHRESFEEESVFLRSIAEQESRKVFYSRDHVEIGRSALAPITDIVWKLVKKKLPTKTIQAHNGQFQVTLPTEALSRDFIKVSARFQDAPEPPLWEQVECSFDYTVDGDGPQVLVPLPQIFEELEATTNADPQKIELRVHFVAK